MRKLSDYFPSVFGIGGTLTNIFDSRFDKLLNGFVPSLAEISILIIYGVIGGTIGYFVKLFWDKFFKTVKNE